MSLDTQPARKLTSRELAKILSGTVGALAEWNDADDIFDALKFFQDHEDGLREVWAQTRRMSAEILKAQGQEGPS